MSKMGHRQIEGGWPVHSADAPSPERLQYLDALILIERLRAALDAHHRGLTLMGDDASKCAICALATAKEVGR